MRISLISAGVALLFSTAAADASSDADLCSASLTAQWRDSSAAHPIDPAKHIPVVLIDIPLKSTGTQYKDAIRALTNVFPSFIENPGSGILTGCCSFPIFGSISFDDLAKLTAARFASLCDVGDRSISTHMQLRIEYREPYESGMGTDPYFWISWPPVR